MCFSLNPAKKIHSPIVGSLSGQRRERWTVIDLTVDQWLVFAGGRFWSPYRDPQRRQLLLRDSWSLSMTWPAGRRFKPEQSEDNTCHQRWLNVCPTSAQHYSGIVLKLSRLVIYCSIAGSLSTSLAWINSLPLWRVKMFYLSEKIVEMDKCGDKYYNKGNRPDYSISLDYNKWTMRCSDK